MRDNCCQCVGQGVWNWSRSVSRSFSSVMFELVIWFLILLWVPCVKHMRSINNSKCQTTSCNNMYGFMGIILSEQKSTANRLDILFSRFIGFCTYRSPRLMWQIVKPCTLLSRHEGRSSLIFSSAWTIPEFGTKINRHDKESRLFKRTISYIVKVKVYSHFTLNTWSHDCLALLLKHKCHKS